MCTGCAGSGGNTETPLASVGAWWLASSSSFSWESRRISGVSEDGKGRLVFLGAFLGGGAKGTLCSDGSLNACLSGGACGDARWFTWLGCTCRLVVLQRLKISCRSPMRSMSIRWNELLEPVSSDSSATTSRLGSVGLFTGVLALVSKDEVFSGETKPVVL